MTRNRKRHCTALLLVTLCHLANAQPIAIPAWMQPYFAEGSTTILPAGDRGPVKHNSFIGSYTARMTIHDTLDGITQMLYLSAWQDSTRGVMQLELVRGLPHTIWFADIGANMGVVANAIGRKAVVSDLHRVLLVDRLREPGKIREFAPLHGWKPPAASTPSPECRVRSTT
jgi:hypothetical protein